MNYIVLSICMFIVINPCVAEEQRQENSWGWDKTVYYVDVNDSPQVLALRRSEVPYGTTSEKVSVFAIYSFSRVIWEKTGNHHDGQLLWWNYAQTHPSIPQMGARVFAMAVFDGDSHTKEKWLAIGNPYLKGLSLVCLEDLPVPPPIPENLNEEWFSELAHREYFTSITKRTKSVPGNLLPYHGVQLIELYRLQNQEILIKTTTDGIVHRDWTFNPRNDSWQAKE